MEELVGNHRSEVDNHDIYIEASSDVTEILDVLDNGTGRIVSDYAAFIRMLALVDTRVIGADLCVHGNRFLCKACGGSLKCSHGRDRKRCMECSGCGRCVHGKEMRRCKDCGGRAICLHDRQKASCRACGGTNDLCIR